LLQQIVCFPFPPQIPPNSNSKSHIHLKGAQYEDEYTINKRAGIAHKLFDGDIDLRPSEYEFLQKKYYSDPESTGKIGWSCYGTHYGKFFYN
jgi:hypothetical protein